MAEAPSASRRTSQSAPGGPGSGSRPTRREEYSESTRRALVDHAAELFAERGYAGTSLDEVVARARVTKGALYHHFAGKQGLFEAVFDRYEAVMVERSAAAVADQRDAVAMAVAGLEAYLDVCLDPGYQRVVLQDAPAIFGYEQWREREEDCALGLIRRVVTALDAAGELPPLPLETLSQLLFGAFGAAAVTIAAASDPRQSRAEVIETIVAMLAGLRIQAAGAGG